MTAARGDRKRLPAWAWAAIVAGTIAGLVWIVVLPMRQTPFRIADHVLVADGGPAIEGRLVRHGEAAADVLVEAYLYDGRNRYLGTARTRIDRIAADGEARFRIPLAEGEAGRVARYSLYAGTRPNPFAPGR